MMKTKTYQDRHFQSIGCCFLTGQKEVHLGEIVFYENKQMINKQTNNKQRHWLLLFERTNGRERMMIIVMLKIMWSITMMKMITTATMMTAKTTTKTCTVAFLRSPLVSVIMPTAIRSWRWSCWWQQWWWWDWHWQRWQQLRQWWQQQ